MARKLSQHLLDNGLTVEFWDHSRVTAGDRWQVVLEWRVAIPLKPDYLPPELAERREEVLQILGTEVVFSQQEIRHFIAADQKNACLEEMQTRLLAGNRSYLGHPQFPARFIRRQWTLRQEKKPWQTV
jgi:hypothetical protein